MKIPVCKLIAITTEVGETCFFKLEDLSFVITCCCPWVTLFKLLDLMFLAGEKKMK